MLAILRPWPDVSPRRPIICLAYGGLTLMAGLVLGNAGVAAGLTVFHCLAAAANGAHDMNLPFASRQAPFATAAELNTSVMAAPRARARSGDPTSLGGGCRSRVDQRKWLPPCSVGSHFFSASASRSACRARSRQLFAIVRKSALAALVWAVAPCARQRSHGGGNLRRFPSRRDVTGSRQRASCWGDARQLA